MFRPKTEIIVYAGEEPVCRYVVEPGEYLIGRDPVCPIRVDMDRISRMHARLIVNYNELLIEDLGSSNGTYVNGARVTEATRLWPTQRIRVGPATIAAHRLRGEEQDPESLAPWTADLKRYLPPEFLRERKYEIRGEAGHGGMGVVLDAKDAVIGRTVAMKVMLVQASRENLIRFIEEAQITGQLEHPNIVPVHELGVDAHDQVFYTMKYVQGITLKAIIDGIRGGDAEIIAKFPLAALLSVFQKVCDAVAFAHSKGVIHRDLKPENVMVGKYGEVLVMDWGLSKILEEAEVEKKEPARSGTETGSKETEDLSRTLDGMVVGTPNFMSPEQAEGAHGAVNERTDIFALGAILYNVLTLRMALTGATREEIFEKLQKGAFAPPSSFNQAQEKISSRKRKGGALALEPGETEEIHFAHCPGGKIPRALSAVTMKAMEMRPEDRYQSVQDLQKEITAYQGGFATGAQRAGAFTHLGLFLQRHRTAAISLFCSAAIIAAFTVVAMVQVIASERRAQSTLDELRKTVPLMEQEVLDLVQQHHFTEALQKASNLSYLVPASAEYRMLQGDMQESLLQFEQARSSFAAVLKLNGDYPLARENLDLCEKVIHEAGSPGEREEDLLALHNLMDRGERYAEAAVILQRLGAKKKQLFEIWKARLAQGGIDAEHLAKLRMDVDGLLMLDLENMPIQDLSALKGMPFKRLALRGSKVSDLAPLKGMPLRYLDLGRSPVSDLGPIRGMTLTFLNLDRTNVSDLRPLEGMPIAYLYLAGTKVSDISPLRGMPIHRLSLASTDVNDIGPLKGMPLTELNLSSTPVTDVSVLAESQLLEKLVLPRHASDIEFLREFPAMQRLSMRQFQGMDWDKVETAGEFWKEFDSAKRPWNGQIAAPSPSVSGSGH